VPCAGPWPLPPSAAPPCADEPGAAGRNSSARERGAESAAITAMLAAITAVSAKLFFVVNMLIPHLARVFQRTKGAHIGAAPLIVDDPAVFDAKNAIRKRHDARI